MGDYECTQCGQSLSSAGWEAGAKVQCGRCGHAFTWPPGSKADDLVADWIEAPPGHATAIDPFAGLADTIEADFCPACKRQVSRGLTAPGDEKSCPHCQHRFAWPGLAAPVENFGHGHARTTVIGGKIVRPNRRGPELSEGVAMLLTLLLPGLGHLYCGQVSSAAVVFAIGFVNVMLLYVCIGVVTLPLFWVWAVIDARNTARKLNGD